MFEICDEILISSTPEKVFAKFVSFFQDSEHYKEWHHDHVSCEWEKSTDVSHESVLSVCEYLNGKKQRLRFKILTFVKNKCIEYKLLFPYSLLRCYGSFSFSEQSNSTIFKASIRFGVHKMFKAIFLRHIDALMSHMKEEGLSIKVAVEKELSDLSRNSRGTTMNHKERMLAGLPFKIWRDGLLDELTRTKMLLYAFNTCKPNKTKKLDKIIRKILNKAGSWICIDQPFHCDFGSNISVGEDFYANSNCTILDCGRVTIGDNVLFGPNVSVFTAGHPIHPDSRNSRYQYGIEVTIGNNVWVCGNVVINPGVTIGDNVVIASGSVVTKDIEANVLAAGNPCKVIRKITEEDRKYYFKDRVFDVDDYLPTGE